MNDQRVKEILQLIQSGVVRWTIVGTHLSFYTGEDRTPVRGMKHINQRFYHRRDYEHAPAGMVDLTPAGEDALRDLGGDVPKRKSIWS